MSPDMWCEVFLRAPRTVALPPDKDVRHNALSIVPFVIHKDNALHIFRSKLEPFDLPPPAFMWPSLTGFGYPTSVQALLLA